MYVPSPVFQCINVSVLHGGKKQQTEVNTEYQNLILTAVLVEESLGFSRLRRFEPIWHHMTLGRGIRSYILRPFEPQWHHITPGRASDPIY